eukprot:479750_1
MSFLQSTIHQHWSLQDTISKQRLIDNEHAIRQRYKYHYRPKIKDAKFFISSYVRHIECIYDLLIPIDINIEIIKFYPNYRIYVCGRNDKYGALGLNHKNKIHSFTLLSDLSLLCCDINNIYLNASRIFIKNIHNEIYASGSNKYNELASLNSDSIVKYEWISYAGNNIKFVSNGADNFYHTFFCSNNSQLYVCGCNYRGQFGNGIKSLQTFKTMPIKIDNTFITVNGDTIKDIQCGCRHTVFLSNYGLLFCVGSNMYGQVGQPYNTTELLTPKHIKHKFKIKEIKCGRFRTLFIDIKQKLYGFGWNDRNQLGADNAIQSVWNSRSIEYFNGINIIKIATGSGHTICLDDNGNCYTFGWNKYSQCGHNCTDKLNNKMHKIDLGYEFSSRIVDMDGGFAHSVILNDENKVFTFGYNIYKQCSVVNKSQKIHSPYYVSKSKEMMIEESVFIEKVMTMPDSTLIVVNSNMKNP